MKKLKHILVIYSSILLLIIIMCRCDWIMEKEYPLNLENNAIFSTTWYLALGGKNGTEYPDTSLPQTDEYVIYNILPKTTHMFTSGNKWKDVYSMLHQDTMSVFVLHTDTVNKYSWDEVRIDYKILKRYDLSYDDLLNTDWKITYP